MHWIESFFGILPDNNSGATELLLFFVSCAGLAAWRLNARLFRSRRRPKKAS